MAIYRTGNSTGATTVGHTTVNGTAIAGADYSATSGTVTWSDGETAIKTVAVPVTSRAAGKEFAVALTSVEGQANFGSPSAATVAVALTPGGTSSSSSSGGSGSPSGSPSSSSSGSTSSSGPSASANGTMIPSAGQIVDSAHNVWTVASGVVYENGKTAAYSANVSLLLYDGDTVYQENNSCLWWLWNGSAWVASSNPAPSITPACSSSTAAAAPAVSSPTTTPTGTFGIKVSGNKLVSVGDGSVVHLRGANVADLAQMETGGNAWPSFGLGGEPIFASMAAWHMNVVRFALNEGDWLRETCGSGTHLDPQGTYQAAIAAHARKA